ncbi:hypothetical protein ABW21_db0204407 [Orbilia brochopaga]|nr:hypothetical protein ABW21_db0204407 [Drechslerella brochopaga]
MPSVPGFVRGINNNRLLATFVVNDIQYTFQGHCSTPVLPFESNDATLEYSSEHELTTSREFEGEIGPVNISLMVSNGPRINGHLNMPMEPSTRVTGSAVWTMS